MLHFIFQVAFIGSGFLEQTLIAKNPLLFKSKKPHFFEQTTINNICLLYLKHCFPWPTYFRGWGMEGIYKTKGNRSLINT